MSTTFSLTGQVRVTPSWVDDLSTTDLVDSVTFLQSLSLASGTGAGQATAYWRDVLSVGAAATVTIDLEQLTVNVFGGSGGLNLETQKLILVRNRSTTIGVAVALGTAVTADLDPGGIVLATSTATGWSEDELTLTNAGGSAVSVEVYLVGLAGIYVAPVGPSARTLYWNNALDNNSWTSLGNWWDDASHTDPAASIPTSIDSVVITGGGIIATGQTVVDFTIANSSSLNGTLTVTGVATFNSTAVNNGTITGNAVFNDNAENAGTVNGNATFNDNAANSGTVTGTVTDNT